MNTLIAQEDFSPPVWNIIDTLSEYYSNDTSVPTSDLDYLKDALARKYPRFKDRFNGILDDLEAVSVPNVLREVRELKVDTTSSLLAEAIMAGDRTSQDALFEKLTYYKSFSTMDDSDGVFINTDLDEILEVHKAENLIPIIPKELNDRIDGGVIPGTQIAVYAPTEVGKTMFAINMACGMLMAGKRVLYCCNEDPAKSMLLRFHARLSEMDKAAMMSAPRKAKDLAIAKGYGGLVFYDMDPGSVSEIQRQVDKHQPDIVFIDQMANMGTNSNFSKTEKNEYLSVKFRELAKKNDIVTVIMHQASDDAYGNLFIQKNDMYYSNVGVQGQMDLMIGIGMDPSYEQAHKRMICITKNKLSGNHDAFPVDVNESISKISGG